MSRYIFIESRDPFESRDTRFVQDTAAALRQQGHEVIVFLVQNGVLSARRNGDATRLSDLHQAGVKLLADDFSLSERGIQSGELVAGVEPANVATLVEMLVQDQTKAIWH